MADRDVPVARLTAISDLREGSPVGEEYRPEKRAPPGRVGRPEWALHLAFVLEDLGPVCNQTVKRLLGGAVSGNHVVMHTVLHRQQ